jgi:pimeloyl-ACP methyl ester carboxylesterase
MSPVLFTRRRLLWLLGLIVFVTLAVALHRRLLCAGLFLRLEGQSEPSFIVHYRERKVSARPFAFSGGRGVLYLPEGEREPSGVVLAHGMHELGVTDPRLVGFARALAGAGIAVLTPEVVGLAHYKIVHSDVALIAASARALATQLKRPQVTVFGISFGGGLALRAACEPALRGAIDRVLALGAHNDALRVTRFYLGRAALGPEGQRAAVEPHPYGQSSLWMSLFGEKKKRPLDAKERALALQGLADNAGELALASPSACPEPVRVPVHLVHGTGDRIVPYTESLWNARQLAEHTSVDTLISPAIVHAEYDPPTWWERVQLVEFIVGALF